MLSQLDGQIDKKHPIGTARQGPPQEKQADTQQPQANGLGTRAHGDHHTLEGGKDQGDAAITAVSLADPGQSQANQQQGVDMPFGARQLFGCNQSPSKERGIRSVLDRLSIGPPKKTQTGGPSAEGLSGAAGKARSCSSNSLTRAFH